ncbi:MAG: ribosomal protein S18-alanine N-acetyltransferase [Clostridiales bacterium]|nr:ribosomal protein S18-alanine N-acetyltransferase [Clostridiales bacterium]
MIRFEVLTRKRIDEILEIEKLCFPGDEWTYSMFESELDNRISVFIVGIDEDTDSVVCYGCVWLIADIGDITNIAVSPDYQGQGLGDRTLELLITLCAENDMSVINLEVKKENFPAVSLYKKHGFEEVGVRKGYYKDGSAAVLMSKYL